MGESEEIAGLKARLCGTERRIGAESIGADLLPAIVALSERLKEMVEDIESTQETGRTMSNTALSVRFRLAKRAMVLGKGLRHFEDDVYREFEAGRIPEPIGDRFIEILKLIKENKMDIAKQEMGYFDGIISLDREYRSAKDEMERKDRSLKRDKVKLENLLEEKSQLEKDRIDDEKADRYGRLLENVGKLKRLRGQYISSLISKPVAALLAEKEMDLLKNFGILFPEGTDISELKRFLSDYPVFGECNAGQVCGFFDYSEGKLSHICPETSRFRKVILGNRALFEAISSLERTGLLAISEDDETVLEFYSQNVDGARETVDSIRKLGKDRMGDRAEYEKRESMERRREELAKHSKEDLEKEIKEMDRLLELLHSEAPAKKEESRGLLGGLRALLFGE